MAANGTLVVTQLLLLSLALGVADTLRGTATQTYSFDLVGAAGATNALALVNLGVFMAGAVGSIVGVWPSNDLVSPPRSSCLPRWRPWPLSFSASAGLEPGENGRNLTWSPASRVR